MTFSMLPLLVYSEDLSEDLRDTIRHALTAPPDERQAQLEATARALYLEAGTLQCEEIRALVGLD